MYTQIKILKDDGFKKAQVAKKLKISRNTVDKYWNMSLDEYEKLKLESAKRSSILDDYEDFILHLLNKHADYTSSQIHDLLIENYPDEADIFKYSTVNRKVKYLREKHEIFKESKSRNYQAVKDLPPGFQAQVDIGFSNQSDHNGKTVQIACIAMVLSHSRYKYIKWYDSNPTSFTLCDFHDSAFAFFGGRPKEIVYDQDRTLVNDENFGDIIFTAQFERYRQHHKFSVYLCKGADPETKGKIESVIDYAKNNFAKNREYINIELFNQECLDWLKRTGNKKPHGTTKKVPAEVFSTERNHLIPIPDAEINANISNESISRTVRKDNTIVFKSNRYSLPLGTYRPGISVDIKLMSDQLKIYNQGDNELIATHDISSAKGKLIQKKNHLRDHSKKIDELLLSTAAKLGNNSKAIDFLERIKKLKPRYVRDQFSLIAKTVKNSSENEIKTAINYCLDNNLYSATVFKSVIENGDKLQKLKHPEKEVIIPKKYQIEINDRDINEYERLAVNDCDRS